MTGSLQHLGGDRYRVRVYMGRDPLEPDRQKVVSRSFHAKNEQAAKRLMSQHIADLRAEVTAAEGGRGTVAELVKLWERDRADFSPTTKKRNESILRTIRADLGRIQARDLTTLHVDQWLAKLRARDLSPSTVHQYGRVLSTILKDGRRWKKVTVNVAEDARKPKVPRAKVDPPTRGELDLLLSSARGDLQAALWVLALTGVRRGEVCGLRWSDVRGGELHIERTIIELRDGKWLARWPKTRDGRILPVDASLLVTLEAQRNRQESWWEAQRSAAPADCYVFANLRADPTGQTPRRPGWLSLGFKRLCKRHGVKVRLHALRHWNATTLIAMGVPVTTVSKRLGHAQTSTTVNVYGHGTDAGSALAVAALELALPMTRP